MDGGRDGKIASNIFVSHPIKLWARRAKKNSNYGPKELGVEFTLRNETNNKFASKQIQVSAHNHYVTEANLTVLNPL